MITFSPNLLKCIANDPSGVSRGDLCFDPERDRYYAPDAIFAVVYQGRLSLIKPAFA